MTDLTKKSGRDHFNDFDFDSPEFNEHYEEVLVELVDKCPVAHSNVGIGYHVLNRYQDVRTAAQDWKTFSSADGMYPNRPPEMMPPGPPEEVDPPHQKNWRFALNKYFTAKKAAETADAVRAQVDLLIDQFIEAGSCDFVADFAALVPGRVFFTCILDAPLEDLPRLIQVVDDAQMGPIEGQGAAWAEISDYMSRHLEKRQSMPPQDDFIDAILAGVDKGNGEMSSWEDKVGLATLVLSGGVGTTASAIASMGLHLVTHPDDFKVIRENPDLRANAVDEVLRRYSPATVLSRTATRDVEVAGTMIKEGERVMVNFASSCLDPQVFPNPMEFRFDREYGQSGAFGFGPHHCLGAHIARVEIKAALDQVAARMPDLRLASPESYVPEYSTGLVRTLHSLPVKFTPGTRVLGR